MSGTVSTEKYETLRVQSILVIDDMRLGAWLRSGEGIGWLAAGTNYFIYQTLSIECPSSIFFWHVLRVIVPFLLSFLFLFCFVLFCFVLFSGLRRSFF